MNAPYNLLYLIFLSFLDYDYEYKPIFYNFYVQGKIMNYICENPEKQWLGWLQKM